MKLRLPKSRAARVALLLLVLNEIRGLIVVAGILGSGAAWLPWN